MTEQNIDQIKAASDKTFDAWKRLASIQGELARRIFDVQFQLASLGVECSAEQLSLMSKSANYKDLLGSESKVLADYANKYLELTRDASEAVNEAREEFVTWVDGNVSEISGKIVEVSKSVTKSGRKAAV